ncbi:MAG: NAD-dependent epimerase/dehydratase family protein [Candidatus Omnitrophota bacterium]|jgi:3,5-epimerase/4-reductase|nr:MAG: NAD-dependent epimerase/dehydratase family protein [Candidatus Omnitrophota bacterium]
MNERILILGNGYIGQRLHEGLGCEVSERKIYSLADAEEEIKKFKPAVLINAIGYIGNTVDDCEQDKDKALMANAFVPLILGEAAIRNHIKLVHISSGCIYRFDYLCDDPIAEEKVPDYFDLFYSRTKIYSEQPLLILSKSYPILIVRIRVPLDNRPHPRNLLDKLIKYKKIIDVPNSLTYVPDFIQAMKHLLKVDARGIYNVVNKGSLKYPDLMYVYKKYVPAFEYEVVDLKNLSLKRTNLIMSCEKLEKTGFKMRNIKDVLEECVREYLNARGSTR